MTDDHHAHSIPTRCNHEADECPECAAEIARLRADVEELRDELKDRRSDVAHFRDENEKLKRDLAFEKLVGEDLAKLSNEADTRLAAAEKLVEAVRIVEAADRVYMADESTVYPDAVLHAIEWELRQALAAYDKLKETAP